MIVDFINIKKQLHKYIELYLRKTINENTSLVRLCKKIVYFEGKKSSEKLIDGNIKDVKFIDIGENFSFTKEQLKTLTLENILEEIHKVAKNMAKKQELLLLTEIDRTTKETGNIVKNTDNTSPETFLETLEKVPIDFKNGIPVKPTIIAGEETIKKIMESMEKMSEEEKKEFNKKEQAIYEKKYKEYLSRENNRKLVD